MRGCSFLFSILLGPHTRICRIQFMRRPRSGHTNHIQRRSHHESHIPFQLQRIHDPALLGNCRKYFYCCRHLQFCRSGRISHDRLFRHIHHPLSILEHPHRPLHDFFEHPGGCVMLQTSRQEIFCKFDPKHDHFFRFY